MHFFQTWTLIIYSLPKKSRRRYREEVRWMPMVLTEKQGVIRMKELGVASALLFMQQLGFELFDLVNEEKNFRIDVTHNPETGKAIFRIIEPDEDGNYPEN
jgi:hypothetical protein